MVEKEINMNQSQKRTNGVEYYNIDNKSIRKDNEENIVNTFSLLASTSSNKNSSQEEAKPEGQVVAQAPTPPSMDTVLRMVSQIFYNTNSTQKHKLKVRLNHTDKTNTEWIATMNKDARIFRRHTDLELARGWIQATKRKFSQELGYKTPYYGKFHLHKDHNGVVPGIQKEPNCYASMAYNTEDESWYVMLAIYDFIATVEYDYNFSKQQKAQGVRAQTVWTNPKNYRGGQTWAQRNQ
jgi:hypothetical protein